MPRTKSWGSGRTCLLAVPSGVDAKPVVAALESVGFATASVSTESGALAARERANLAAAFVSQKLGPLALSSITARAAHSHPQIPVIVLGSSNSIQDAVDAMQHGCADYVPLPVEPDALLERARKLLTRRPRARSPPRCSPASWALWAGPQPSAACSRASRRSRA